MDVAKEIVDVVESSKQESERTLHRVSMPIAENADSQAKEDDWT
jgi:hypothetical protein